MKTDLVGVMPLGYAAETRERSRRPLEQLVFQDTFGTPWRRDSPTPGFREGPGPAGT